jgi:glycosyltransferase involved in cell wall biosynthesis
MKKENPLVSIIVRTKDRPKLLERAIQSIAAQIYRPIEVILVNDGGCDLNVEELMGILGDISLKYIRLEKNTGRANAGNVGIESAKGSYIGFLDDDDEFYPKHIALLVSALEQIDYKIAYTDSEIAFIEYDTDKKEFIGKEKRVFSTRDFSFADLVVENYIPLINLLFKKEVLVSVGGFDESLELFEDWDLLIRSGEIYPFYHVKKVTSKYVQWSKDLQIARPEGYQRLSEIAYDKVTSKHKDKFTPDVVRHFREVSHKLIRASHLLGERNEAILNKDSFILEKDTQIARFENVIKGKDAQIAQFEFIIKGKDIQIEQLEAQIAQFEDIIKGKDSQIAQFENIIKGKDSQIAQIGDIIKGKDSQIAQIGDIIKGKDSQIAQIGDIIKGKDSQIAQFENIIKGKDSQIAQFENIIKGKDSQIAQFENFVKEKDNQMVQIDNILREKDIEIDKLKARIAQIEAIKRKEIEIAQLEATINEKDALIIAMTNTLGWQLLAKFRKTRDRFLPLGSKRKNFYNKAINAFKILIACGISTLIKKIKEKIHYKVKFFRKKPNPPEIISIIENRGERIEGTGNAMIMKNNAFDGAINMKADRSEISEKLKEFKLELIGLIESSRSMRG